MNSTRWAIDPTHSEIQFKVKHLMISTLTGKFNSFDSQVETIGEDFTMAKIKFTAAINSISTNNEQRDAHLLASDFFDAENHPLIIFEGSKMEKISDENFTIHGTITMRGVSKNIELNAEFGGIAQDNWGNTRAGFSVTGKLNRKDFGVSFSMLTETGGIALGEEVKILANVQFIKEAITEPA